MAPPLSTPSYYNQHTHHFKTPLYKLALFQDWPLYKLALFQDWPSFEPLLPKGHGIYLYFLLKYIIFIDTNDVK